MTRGAYVLARVAVMIRVPARWLWWLGVLAAGIGLFVPSLTGRRIGVLGGAALFIIAAAITYVVRRRRYVKLADGATRAAKSAFLQDRRVTARIWSRAHRWWLLAAFAVALGSSAAAPAAGGMLLAGAGAGLWAKARWLGRWERRHGALLWVRPEWAAPRGPVGRGVSGYQSTGPAAGDAGPGGARVAVARGGR
ncbi:hypothetical protein [Actinacidiphila oryziradicis]|uniref:Integral membrane protein n=1 Tax=Actinacidiphila oryziradicis TaxID=2571141 RepID=A0A4U0SK73_9ACTN|nr:hypothetical protein [Actinacidiphila oryziradicis]TKA10052.1 hypothetical protein FCI23_19185 [Actinacidiphila oryziradicis]